MGLTPQFTDATIIADLERFARDQESKFIEALAFIGETFVNEARQKRTYQDITGNLRSSIGYSIVKDGKAISFKVQGGSSEGKIEAADFVRQKIVEIRQSGIYLIVFAGMEYALYVEAKGFDVLTGSRPSRAKVINTFKSLLL